MPVHTVVIGPDDADHRVILIHGALDRHNAFRRVARRLEQHRVVMYDRRGYGKSLDLGAAPDISRQVADLLTVVGDEPAIVVGHSLGGLVALAAAAEFPNLFPAIGAFEPPTPWKPWWPRYDSDPEIDAPPAEVIEWFYRTVVGDHAWERLSDRLRTGLIAEGPALTADLLVGRDGPIFDTASITVPVMLGFGGRSLERHVRAVHELQHDLPDAALMEIPDASHGAHRSHADAFAAFVEATVARSG